MEERRTCTRVDYGADVTLEYEGESFPSKFVDLSIKGALVDTTACPKNGDEIVLSFSAAAGEDESAVTLRCPVTVVRSERRGIGVQFARLGSETLTELCDLVASISPDPEVIKQEFQQLVRVLESDS